MSKNINHIFDFLLKWQTVLVSLGLGILAGVLYSDISKYLRIIIDVYVSLLEMGVIPIVGAVTLIGIGDLSRNSSGAKISLSIIKTFIIVAVVTCVVSIVISISLTDIFGIGAQTRSFLGSMVSGESENGAIKSSVKFVEYKSGNPNINKTSLIEILTSIIPSNIFYALSQGDIIKILFVVIIIGVMLRYIDDDNYNTIVLASQGINDAFQIFVQKLMYLMPLALFAMGACQFKNINITAIKYILLYVVILIVSYIVIFILCTIVMWVKIGGNYFSQFKYFREGLFISFGSRNNLIAMPSIVKNSQKIKGCNKEKMSIAMLINISLCNYDSMIIFITATIYAAKIYNITLNLSTLGLIIILCILISFSATGVSGIAMYSSISIVFTYLSIPPEVIIALLVSIDSIIDMFAYVYHLYVCTLASVIMSKEGNSKKVMLKS